MLKPETAKTFCLDEPGRAFTFGGYATLLSLAVTWLSRSHAPSSLASLGFVDFLSATLSLSGLAGLIIAYYFAGKAWLPASRLWLLVSTGVAVVLSLLWGTPLNALVPVILGLIGYRHMPRESVSPFDKP